MTTELATKELDIYRHTCLRCSRTWETENPKPKTCRYCKSYLWREPKGRV